MRLEMVAALGMTLAVPALAAGPQGTDTKLTAETRIANGRTQTTVAVTVTGDDGLPATGAVVIADGGKQVAGAALSTEGKARIAVSLTPGAHSLTAIYQGDAKHTTSASETSAVQATAAGAFSYGVSVAPASMSLTAGQSGTAVVSVTPVNASSLSGPMFVTLSCSGFPDQSSCTFTPENVEILQNATTAVTSSMVITTQAESLAKNEGPGKNPVEWALLLPGSLGLMGLAFSARRRRWLSRLSLIALVGFVSILGATACAPRYNYYNHGPPYNLPTPAGTYTLQVTAQASNGITASTQSAPFALTVK
jgi:hypothetical protein